MLRAFTSEVSSLSAIEAGAACSILHLCYVISQAPITLVIVGSEVTLQSLCVI
jgi:hypothetical protein